MIKIHVLRGIVALSRLLVLRCQKSVAQEASRAATAIRKMSPKVSTRCKKAARLGKMLAFTVGFNTPNNTSALGIDESHLKVSPDEAARKTLVFPMGISLICAGEHRHFRIQEGHSADEDKRWMRWLPQDVHPLGPPSGPVTKGGLRYCRKFQNATVQLGIQKQTASFQ